MARIAGVDLPREKRVEIGLTYIFGLGRTRAIDTVKGTRVNPNTRVRDLSEEEVVRLREWIDSHYKVEGDLRREVQQDIKRKIEIGCYQGIRHRRGFLAPDFFGGKSPSLLCYFLVAFFLPATVFLGPLRVRALVWVRWPRTGSPRRCRIPW